MVRAALRREISRLRTSWERFLSAPIPTHTPARDDGGGGHPYRHFDRSEAEWRNLLPLMVRAALRWEISRLRTSWERFLSSPIPTHTPARDDGGGGHPYRHFDRSGAEWRNLLPLMVRAALRREISRLRTSWERFLSSPIPTHTPARDDGGGGPPYRHFDRSGAEWRNLTPLMTEKPARALSSFRP